MNRQRQINPEDYITPPPPGAASVRVNTASDTGRTGCKISTGSRESTESLKQSHGSSTDGEYVLVSVRDSSMSGSESSSRRSSENGSVTASSVPYPSGVVHSRTSSNSSNVGSSVPHPSGVVHSRTSSNSSSVDPFTPISPRGVIDSNGQNVMLAGNAGNVLGADSLGNFQTVPNGTDVQNLALAGNIGNAGNLVGNTNTIPNPTVIGGNQSSAFAGNTGQNAVFFPTVGNLPNVALAGNATNVLAANPGQMLGGNNLVYGGGTFLPAATSSMAALPQGGLDPLLLQQQYAFSPDLLAASLAQTLALSQGNTLDQLQSPASLPQGQNLNLSQTQAMLQNLSLAQAQGTAQTSMTQATDLQQQRQMHPSLSRSASTNSDSLQGQVPSPPAMGHSFDVLSAVVAANQASLTTPPLQSPTSPAAVSPAAVSPQLLPMGSTSGLPPSLTGLLPLHSVDLLGNHQQESPSEMFTKTAGVPDHALHVSSSSDNGDDQTTSGVGSSVPSTPSDSNPTSPNSDLYPLTSEDERNVQIVGVMPCYDRPSDKSACMRCGRKVYNMEKLGPVKDVLYHKTCFTCVACHSKLNLKTFHNNEADLADLNVYCASHKPPARATRMDSSAMGIRRALTVPRQDRVNEQIRGGPEMTSVHLDSHSVSIRSAMNVPAPDLQAANKLREGAWFREQRKYEKMPPKDVVRHDEQSQKYEGSRSLYLDAS